MALYSADGVPENGSSVSESETVLRCVPPSTWDWDEDGPTTASLSFRKGEIALSVYLLKLLETRGLGASDTRERRERHGVVSFSASLAYTVGCVLTHSPAESDPPLQVDFAHADLHKMEKAAWLVARDRLLEGAETVIRPQDGRG